MHALTVVVCLFVGHLPLLWAICLFYFFSFFLGVIHTRQKDTKVQREVAGTSPKTNARCTTHSSEQGLHALTSKEGTTLIKANQMH